MYDVVFYATLDTATCAADKVMLYNDDNQKLLNKTTSSVQRKLLFQKYTEALKQIEEDMAEDVLDDAVVSNSLELQEKENPAKEEWNQKVKRRAEFQLFQRNKRLKVSTSEEQIRQVRKLARRDISVEGSVMHFKTQVNIQEQQQDQQQDKQQQQEQHDLQEEDVAATSDSPALNDPTPDDAMRHLQHIKKDLHEKIQKSLLSSDPESVHLSKFNGNASDWNLNEQESKVFTQNAMEIQESAKRFNKICERFKVSL